MPVRRAGWIRPRTTCDALSATPGPGERLTIPGARMGRTAVLAALDILCASCPDGVLPALVAEAGAAGLPVIAECRDGATAQIADGETGILVPSRGSGRARRRRGAPGR